MAEMEGKKPMRGIEVKHEFKCTTPVQLRFNDIDTLGHLTTRFISPCLTWVRLIISTRLACLTSTGPKCPF